MYKIEIDKTPLVIPQNNDFGRTYAIVDSDGQKIDLNGCRFFGQIKKSRNINLEAEYTFDSDQNDNSCTIDLLNSEVTIFIPRGVCETFDFEKAEWDFLVVWSNATTNTIARGKVVLFYGVSKLP